MGERVYNYTPLTLGRIFYLIKKSINSFLVMLLIIPVRRKKFVFQNNEYYYFNHIYNTTWNNERTIEVPIFQEILRKQKGCILEIGNVLSHYMETNWTILDKYEKSKKVINEDIVDFDTKKKFDLILSISTLEHIGFDEPLKNPNKVILAIKKIKNLLNKKGKFIFSAPVGYNKFLDTLIFSKMIKINKMFFLKKTSWLNTWRETTEEEIKKIKWNKPHIGANGIIIEVIKKN